MESEQKPHIVLVMGVAGSGKSTIGKLLAGALGYEYTEGDDYHTPANVAKMREGKPLTEADREPWLRSLAAFIGDRLDDGRPAVVACSALKRKYREALHAEDPRVLIVYLDGDRATITRRLVERSGHFFRADLIASQFRDLEPPADDENALYVPVTDPPDAIVERVMDYLGED
ncbi:gluconokinase [Actinomadura flavalba]|uniref:gluconokinase n=1 Tax=Actinomadura flavalba TaxID=1120938 RepID=UPI0003628555|nr:gluconokinase [Actinomadura flavalba]